MNARNNANRFTIEISDENREMRALWEQVRKSVANEMAKLPKWAQEQIKSLSREVEMRTTTFWYRDTIRSGKVRARVLFYRRYATRHWHT